MAKIERRLELPPHLFHPLIPPPPPPEMERGGFVCLFFLDRGPAGAGGKFVLVTQKIAMSGRAIKSGRASKGGEGRRRRGRTAGGP